MKNSNIGLLISASGLWRGKFNYHRFPKRVISEDPTLVIFGHKSLQTPFLLPAANNRSVLPSFWKLSLLVTFQIMFFFLSYFVIFYVTFVAIYLRSQFQCFSFFVYIDKCMRKSRNFVWLLCLFEHFFVSFRLVT